MLLYYFFLLLSFGSYTAQAQNLFQRKIHVSDSMYLVINATASTPDGGVLLGSNQVLLKIAPNGTIDWVKRIRADSSSLIMIVGLSVDSTGDIIFTGRWFANAKNLFFGRCSSEGILKWYKVYSLGGRDVPEFQVALSDGSFLVGGETQGVNEKTFLIKFNAEGDILWNTFLATKSEQASPFLTAALEAPDHSLFTVGSIYNHLPTEPIITITSIHVEHYSPTGELLEKHIYGLDSLSITAHCLLRRNDGSLVLAGEATEPYLSNEPSTPLLLALDSNFRLLWNTRISFLSFSEGIRQLMQLNDGRLLVNTSTDPIYYESAPENPCHIATFSGEGRLETLESIMCQDKVLRGIFLTPQTDNSYAGMALIDNPARWFYNLSIFTIDSSLSGCSTISSRDSNIPIAVKEIQEPALLLHNFTPVPLQRKIIFSPFKIDSNILVCLDSGLSVASSNNEMISSLTVYPNPAPSNTVITIELPISIKGDIQLSLKDVSGKTVYILHKNISPENKNEIQFSLKGLASGIYIVEITEAYSIRHWRQKLIVQ